MAERIVITAIGEQRLRKDLERLKKVERPAITQAIAEARAHGDLSENAEYHAARENQGLVEARIKRIEAHLSQAEIIDVTKIPHTGRVVFGSTVEVHDSEGNTFSWQIVGEIEADAEAARLSINSPVVRALIGREEGEKVPVETPAGEMHYLIKKVRHI